MKKYIIALFLMTLGYQVSAQLKTLEETIGVPLGQSVDKTIAAFKAKGLKIIDQDNQVFVVMGGGKFFDLDARIVLNYSKQTVYQIGIFYEHNDFSEAYETFKMLNTKLTAKHGDPKKRQLLYGEGKVSTMVPEGKDMLIHWFKGTQTAPDLLGVSLVLDMSNSVRIWLSSQQLAGELLKGENVSSTNVFPLNQSKAATTKFFMYTGTYMGSTPNIKKVELYFVRFNHLNISDAEAYPTFEDDKLANIDVVLRGQDMEDVRKKLADIYGKAIALNEYGYPSKFKGKNVLIEVNLIRKSLTYIYEKN